MNSAEATEAFIQQSAKAELLVKKIEEQKKRIAELEIKIIKEEN